MKLTQLTEQKERPYICVHAKKGKHETHAVSSYDAAKNAAEHWGMKSTAGISAHLADVEHVAEEVITEGPCDIAKPEEIEKMSGEEYDKYAQWKKDCEAEERTTPLSTKRLESYDDYHGDMSKEEYDKTVKGSEMEYTVWVGGTEVTDNYVSKDEARRLYDKYKAQGYDDIQMDVRLKEGSFWGRDDMVKKMKDDEKASGMKKFVKIDDKGNHHGVTTSDSEQWKELIAKGYEEDKDYFKEEVQSGPKAEVGMKMKRMLGDEITIGIITKVSPEGIDVKFEDGKTVTYNDGYYDWSFDKEVPFITYESAKPDFLDLDKDGDKKEPMKKAAKDKKAIKEEEEVYFNYEDIGGNIIVNPKSTVTDQIGELLDRYYDISPMEFDPSKIEIQDIDESMNEDEEAIAARDEFMKVMDLKPKTKTPGPGKQIDTIKKIVADKQNMQVAFDDGKMRVDLYTASAVSQVYDAVKPETQVKIDNMLRTKAGMLKMSDFAFSKFNEGIKEGKRIDEILPALAIAARALAPAVGQVAKKVAGAAIKHPVKTALKTRAVANTMKDKDQTVTQKVGNIAKITQNEAVGEFAEPIYDLIDMHFEGDSQPVFDELVRSLSGDQIKDFVADFRRNYDLPMDESAEELEELQAPYTGPGGIKDKNGKMHKPGSPKANMIQNMKKKVAPANANPSGVKPTGGVKPAGGMKKPSTLNKVGKAVGATASAIKKQIGSPLSFAAQSSGFGNPLSASKQHAKDMIEDAMTKAEEELQEYPKISAGAKPTGPIKVGKYSPLGGKPGSHHPPAKSKPRFKASVNF